MQAMTSKYFMGLTFARTFLEVSKAPFNLLAELDAQILVNHAKLDELYDIERISGPVRKKLYDQKE
jgi:hypothetical protein